MKIDSKIKASLEAQATEIDKILANKDEGIFDMLGSSFKSNMRRWFILMNVLTLIISVAMFWCGYRFFIAEAQDQIFWGVIFLVTVQVQIAAKQWIFNEMNRNNIIREVKRVELAVAELAEKVDTKS